MSIDPPSTAPSPVGRVASVDAPRGLTALLMVFADDLGPAARRECTISSLRTRTG